MGTPPNVHEDDHPASVGTLVRDLAALGVADGDLVMVHASLRAIGPAAGGADAVLLALDRAVGPAGTLVMNVGVRDDWSWVNERPEHERPSLLDRTPPFDAAVAAADPDNGVLAEVFRTAPGTLVSNHPEGRIAARGPLADALLRDVPWDDYYGPGSPLERIVGHGGKILRLGADLGTVTMLHLAEYRAVVPGKRRVRRHRLVSTPDGPVLRTVECLDDSEGIVERGPGEEDYFATITRAYVRTACPSTGRVGCATSELIDGAHLVGWATRWMDEHLVPPSTSS